MADPFEITESFDPQSFAEGLIKGAYQQRDSMESTFKSNLSRLWYRSEDKYGEWTLARVQSVLDAMGTSGGPLFAASALLGYISAVGKVSKEDPAVLAAASAALQGVLTPYFIDGTLDVADYAAPVVVNADVDGNLTIDPSETEYPGPQTETPE